VTKFFVFLSMLTAVMCFAHPPAALEFSYEPDSSILYVSIGHKVNDAGKHYVNKVVVELGDKEIVVQNFRSQNDGENQRVMYRVIDVVEGDRVKVTAYCNISGRKNEVFVVPGPDVE